MDPSETPLHVGCETAGVIVGLELTVTLIVLVFTQYPLVPVMVYVVLAAGEAVTMDAVVLDSPAAGDHE
jgi:hypothetical protein